MLNVTEVDRQFVQLSSFLLFHFEIFIFFDAVSTTVVVVTDIHPYIYSDALKQSFVVW